VDPAEFCSSIVSDTNESKELRLAAANYLLPYLYSKRGAVTPPNYLDAEVKPPHPSPVTITQSNENILYLTGLKASGQIDLLWGDNLIADQCRVRDGLIDDQKLIAAGRDYGDQHILITGGLPELPGTEVIMPQINGHMIDAIEHQPTESVPNNTPDQGREP
jgi:hypothetical protein